MDALYMFVFIRGSPKKCKLLMKDATKQPVIPAKAGIVRSWCTLNSMVKVRVGVYYKPRSLGQLRHCEVRWGAA